MPLRPGEGPFGVILCPGRELASQTFELIQDLTLALAKSGRNYPPITSALLIGGTKLSDQERILRSGVHIIVATPGRLIHFLKEKRITMMFCKYFCMDEADRLIDMGFEEDIRTIMDYFVAPRQTVLFSATMPKTIQAFAKSALVNPIEVNVGRAGAASLNILQEVEYVTQESKIVYLLECLVKTPPPVLIFCENKSDVDSIHEYLLIKGVQAVAIHGGKDQQERLAAVAAFKSGSKDVLIATDIASKGLDFPQIQHVINFDMPKEIENYVHRIGRTGRGGHTGVATTFINKQCSPTILMDLKQLLIEAKQRVPPFLENYEAELDYGPSPDAAAEATGVKGCSFCGGLGHRIATCPKAEAVNKKQAGVATGASSRGLRGDGGGGY
jgi:ATP-dependent RNA helicase DDX41